MSEMRESAAVADKVTGRRTFGKPETDALGTVSNGLGADVVAAIEAGDVVTVAHGQDRSDRLWTVAFALVVARLVGFGEGALTSVAVRDHVSKLGTAKGSPLLKVQATLSESGIRRDGATLKGAYRVAYLLARSVDPVLAVEASTSGTVNSAEMTKVLSEATNKADLTKGIRAAIDAKRSGKTRERKPNGRTGQEAGTNPTEPESGTGRGPALTNGKVTERIAVDTIARTVDDFLREGGQNGKAPNTAEMGAVRDALRVALRRFPTIADDDTVVATPATVAKIAGGKRA